MKFSLVDRVIEYEPGERIVTVKAVSRAEEYLQDHFPTFPVLPGVLMLEALAASAGWLARASEEFRHSMFLLKTARNVTYKSFVTPGRLLRVEVRCRKIDDAESEFDGAGYCDDTEMVKARLTLRHFNLADRSDAYADMDQRLTRDAKAHWAQLRAN